MTAGPKGFADLSDPGRNDAPGQVGGTELEAGAFSFTLDSRIVPAAQRFEFWRTAYFEGGLPLVVEAERRHDFRGLSRISGVPSLMLADLRTSPSHAVIRNKTALARGASGKVMVNLVARGTLVVEQLGQTMIVGPGDIVLLDQDTPWRSLQRGAEAFRTVAISADAFPSSIMDRLPVVLTAGTSPIATLAAGYIRSIPNDATTLAEVGDLIKGQVIALLEQALALPWRRPPERSRLYDALCRIIEGQVGDPDLSAKTLCAQLGVSRSTLFDAVASEGGTLSGLILDRRLEGCLADMQRVGRSTTLAAICEQWGFRSQSTFTRAFQRRFGDPPSRWRPERVA